MRPAHLHSEMAQQVHAPTREEEAGLVNLRLCRGSGCSHRGARQFLCCCRRALEQCCTFTQPDASATHARLTHATGSPRAVAGRRHSRSRSPALLPRAQETGAAHTRKHVAAPSARERQADTREQAHRLSVRPDCTVLVCKASLLLQNVFSCYRPCARAIPLARLGAKLN